MHRFLHYDCVVVPESSISGQTSFPWEKVTLLIEYEPLRKPLFDSGAAKGQSNALDGGRKVPSLERLKLKEYRILRTALKPSSQG